MELKVWVDGAVREVCGLSLDTSCQDVVIALAQAIGQTGRYVLIMKLKGTERNLGAEECPLQQLLKLGQLAAQVQFVLRRKGPSLSEGPHRHPAHQRLSEQNPVKHRGLSSDPSTLPRRTKPKKTLSSSLVELTETSVPPPKTPSTVDLCLQDSVKEETFREVLQQQILLQDLEAQIEALEKETELWEQRVTSAAVPDPGPGLTQELEELQYQLKQNEVELLYGEDWVKELRDELKREQDMETRLDQIHSSIQDQNHELSVLQDQSEHLEQDLQAQAQTWGQSPEVEAQQTGEALLTLTEELHSRLRLSEQLDADFSETLWELQTAEETVKDRLETMEELKKELRQCDLQHFIQQTGVPQRSRHNSLPAHQAPLRKSRIRK